VAGGLRERKKQELRRQLSTAALMLARERGLAFRVEDVVERVGVSRRTFSNYFASKEEAIVDHHVQRARETARILRERPADEPPWEALTAAILEPFAEWASARDLGPEEHRANVIAVLGSPELRAAIAVGSRTANDELARAIADRTGTDPVHDLYPGLAADLALTTQLHTMEFWLHADPPVELVPLLREAFRRLGAGLHPPEE
jgi:AcrR family transcriptional regulator